MSDSTLLMTYALLALLAAASVLWGVDALIMGSLENVTLETQTWEWPE